MCQLVLYRSLVREPMAPILLNLMLKDTGYRNKDGAGIFSESSGLIKTECAFNAVSWRNFFKANKSKTILAHVRAATTSKSGKREISVDNSHPYQIGDVILAHNGSITTKTGYTPKVAIDEESTDSLNFFRDLMDIKQEKDISVIEALKEVMKNYTGKFAFLIFDGADYYAVRGKTATLHKATVFAGKSPVAVFVNTDESDLKDSMNLAVHVYALVYDASVDFKIEALEKDTIYRLEGLNLNKVGDIEENEIPVVQRAVTVYDNDDWWDKNRRQYRETVSTTSKYVQLNTLSQPLRSSLDTLIKLKIRPDIFDKWCLATIGIGATTLTERQIISVVDFILVYNGWCVNRSPIVEDYFVNNTKIHKLISRIVELKMKEEVQWPFELNTVEELEDVIKGEKK